MQRFALFRKILPFFMIAALLALPLAAVVGNPVDPASESAGFEISSLDHEGGDAGDFLSNTHPELFFNVDVLPAGELSLPAARLQSALQPALPVLPLKEIVAEIFTPPESVS